MGQVSFWALVNKSKDQLTVSFLFLSRGLLFSFFISILDRVFFSASVFLSFCLVWPPSSSSRAQPHFFFVLLFPSICSPLFRLLLSDRASSLSFLFILFLPVQQLGLEATAQGGMEGRTPAVIRLLLWPVSPCLFSFFLFLFLFISKSQRERRGLGSRRWDLGASTMTAASWS